MTTTTTTTARHDLATRLLDLAASVQGWVRLYGRGFKVYGLSHALLASVPGCMVVTVLRDGAVFVAPSSQGEV